MSCPFYIFKDRSDYYCNVVKKAVSDDIYRSYCRGYDYDSCPNYKNRNGSSGSTGCFLTTACVEAKHLPDDCVELMTLRDFRDNWLKQQPGGEAEVLEYYQKAPLIVEKINQGEEPVNVWLGLYDDLVLPCVQMIQSGDMEGTHQKYRETMEHLLRKYS